MPLFVDMFTLRHTLLARPLMRVALMFSMLLLLFSLHDASFTPRYLLAANISLMLFFQIRHARIRA